MKIVTRDWIVKYTKSEHNTGVNNSQCIILGFPFSELRTGWIDRAEGKVISNASARLFELLHGARGKKAQQRIIADFKQKSLLDH